MDELRIWITARDLERLEGAILDFESAHPDKLVANIGALRRELARAIIVAPPQIPHDVVTMNSRVRFRDLDTEEDFVFTLTLPREAKLDEGKLSILAPAGTALLGCRVGDVIEWPFPGGTGRLQIEEILYQPEAVGEDL